jgi:hypothetical protein
VNQLVDHMTKSCGIEHRLSTKYYPQGRGLAERSVQTATRTIKKCLDGEKAEWDRYVPIVQFYINAKVAALHNSPPFSVMFCRYPRSQITGRPRIGDR